MLGATDVTLYAFAYNTADSTPKTDIVYNTAGLSFGHVRERETEVAATVGGGTAPVTLAADNSAHTDWGFRNIVSNLYRLDYPDSMCAATGSPKFVIPYATLANVFFVFVDPNDLTGGNPRAAKFDATLDNTEREGVAGALRDDFIDFLKDGVAIPATTGNMTAYDSAGVQQTIAVTTSASAEGITATT